MKKLIVITAVAILMAACANNSPNGAGVAEGGISPGNPSNMQEWRDMHGN